MWKESDSDEDNRLVAACRKGDPCAFEQLVHKYQQTMLNLVYHYIGSRNDVEDVAQKIFTKVYFSLPKFDAKRPFFPWLYRIAINQCYDELRRIKRQRIHSFSELSIEETSHIEKLINQNGMTPDTQDVHQDMYDIMHKVIEQLPEQQKRSIMLRDIEGMPYDKMAEILKCTEQAARLKVFRARSRLKMLVEKAIKKH